MPTGRISRIIRQRTVYYDRLRRGVCVSCGSKKRRKQTDCWKCFLIKRKYQKKKNWSTVKTRRNRLLR